jgi:hypothetical protein
LPNATEDGVLGYDTSDVEILRNDGEIQSAREISSGLCGLVFRSRGELCGIEADHPLIAMMREEKGEIESLAVCDPTQTRGDISLSVRGERFELETDSAKGRAYKII